MASNLYDYYTSKGQNLPSVYERQGVASKAGIQNYTGTAEQNKTLLSYLQSTPSNDGYITSDNLKTETKINEPTTTIDTSYGDMNNTVGGYAKTISTQAEKDQAEYDKQTKAFLSALKASGDTSATDAGIYKDNGVDELKKQSNDLTSKIEQEQLDTQEQIAELKKNNPEGLFGGALESKIKDIQDASSLRLARYGIALSAVNRSYDTAYSIAERQITANANKAKADLQARQFVLEQLGSKLSTEQANAFTLQIKSIDNEQSMLNDAIKTATTGMQNGTIDSTTGSEAIQGLMSGTMSLSDFYASIGVNTGSDTTGSDIAGYDITSYATDPTHEQKVLSIYSSIPSVSDSSSAQSVINSLSPNSPITGAMVYNSATKYGVDAGLMISLMQQDSNLGTQGLAVKTKNAGNIGNTDSGQTNTFSSWADGVDAVAKWLSNHKTESKVSYAQYGLLANTTFNPSNNTDKDAKSYLDYYIKNSSIPSSYQLGMGRSATGVNSQRYSNAQARANQLYYEATGSSLPDINTLRGYKTIINNNNKILNNQSITAQTVESNFDLAIKGEITNDVNKNATIINKILNPIYLALGDPATAQALVSNGTISQEFANLISTRNAQGTLMADKMMAEELIQFGTSVEAQKAIVERLKAEAINITGAVKNQNAELYKIIDPLQQLPENPNRVDPEEAKMNDYFSSLGMTDGGNVNGQHVIYIPRIQWSKLNQTYSQSLGMNQGDALIKQLKDKGYTLLVQ